MRIDSRDRFGTPIEQHHTKKEIEKMIHEAALCDFVFLVMDHIGVLWE